MKFEIELRLNEDHKLEEKYIYQVLEQIMDHDLCELGVLRSGDISVIGPRLDEGQLVYKAIASAEPRKIVWH